MLHSTKPASQTTQAGHINLKIFLRVYRLRGLKSSLVRNCHRCRAGAEAAAGIFSVSAPLCACLGEIWAFLQPPPNEFAQLLAGRRHRLPMSGVFRTTIKLRLYYFIILF